MKTDHITGTCARVAEELGCTQAQVRRAHKQGHTLRGYLIDRRAAGALKAVKYLYRAKVPTFNIEAEIEKVEARGSVFAPTSAKAEAEKAEGLRALGINVAFAKLAPAARLVPAVPTVAESATISAASRKRSVEAFETAYGIRSATVEACNCDQLVSLADEVSDLKQSLEMARLIADTQTAKASGYAEAITKLNATVMDLQRNLLHANQAKAAVKAQLDETQAKVDKITETFTLALEKAEALEILDASDAEHDAQRDRDMLETIKRLEAELEKMTADRDAQKEGRAQLRANADKEIEAVRSQHADHTAALHRQIIEFQTALASTPGGHAEIKRLEAELSRKADRCVGLEDSIKLMIRGNEADRAQTSKEIEHYIELITENDKEIREFERVISKYERAILKRFLKGVK
jgi:hypothetical protein